MTKYSLSPLRMIALTVLGSAIVLSGAIAAVTALWQPRPLDAMLPAQGTLALFSYVTREDIREWSDRFPEFRSVPSVEGQWEIGLVDIGSGRRGWILSTPVKGMFPPETNGEFRGQRVLLSDPIVLERMEENSPRLRAMDAFRTLSLGIAPSARRIYMRTSDREALTALPTVLNPFVHASGGVLLSKEGDISNIRVVGKPADIDGSVLSAGSSTLPSLSPAPDVSLSLGAPARMLDLALEQLPANERSIRRGQIVKTIHDLLGNDLSWEFDVLPLLIEPALLHWRTGTGAIPSFAVQGRASDGAWMRARLAAVHEIARGRWTGSSVTRRSFDRGFTSTIVEAGSSQPQDRRYSLNGWTVRETTSIDGNVLLSAVRGRDVVIGNRREWVEGIVTAAHTYTLPGISGYSIAGGLLSPALFAQWTADVRGGAEWAWLEGSRKEGKSILWSIEANEGTLTLSFTSD